MTDEDKRVLNNFEARLRHLIYLYEESKKEITDLQMKITDKDEEIRLLNNNCRDLEAKYTNLKMVRTLSIYDEDIAKTKAKLTSMVRDVDKCIALLNE